MIYRLVVKQAACGEGFDQGARKVDIRLPGKENSNSHGARPVHQIITMKKWIRTSKLSKRTLSFSAPVEHGVAMLDAVGT